MKEPSLLQMVRKHLHFLQKIKYIFKCCLLSIFHFRTRPSALHGQHFRKSPNVLCGLSYVELSDFRHPQNFSAWPFAAKTLNGNQRQFSVCATDRLSLFVTTANQLKIIQRNFYKT